jgi:hypothetical protein
MFPVLHLDPVLRPAAAVWSIATLFSQLITLVVRSSSFSVALGVSGKALSAIAGSVGAACFNFARRLVGSRSDFAGRD